MKNFRLTNPVGLILLLTIVLFSCDPEDLADLQNNPPEAPEALLPELDDGDGALIAVKTITTLDAPIIGSVDTEIGTAVALFTKDNFSSLLNAGKVDIDGEELTKLDDNNTYIYQPDASNFEGLSFGESYEWTVAGSDEIEAFTRTVDSDFPELGKISSEVLFKKSDGYVLSSESVSGAIETICMVGGVVKTIPGNETSVTFTAEELSEIATGVNFIQMASYTYVPQKINGKTFLIGNQTVRTVQVEVE